MGTGLQLSAKARLSVLQEEGICPALGSSVSLSGASGSQATETLCGLPHRGRGSHLFESLGCRAKCQTQGTEQQEGISS